MARLRCAACGCFVGFGHAEVEGEPYCLPCEELLPTPEEEAAFLFAFPRLNPLATSKGRR